MPKVVTTITMDYELKNWTQDYLKEHNLGMSEYIERCLIKLKEEVDGISN